ncbi:MAG: cupin domain-containing protein [Bradyrhizobiaceae bacterium]|nr:MAG: cupin domain-containing protein [Bradyrhizobiaceae bacterium]
MNIASATARTVTWMDTVYTINVDRYQSGGIVGVFESIVPARGGPPVHVHHNEDEVIHVIEGGYEFWLDGDTIPVAAGASIFLPRGVPHTFRVTSTSSGRNLTILTPGGMEEFFVEAAAQNLRMPDQRAEILALAGRYGLEFLAPARGND